MPIIRNLSLLVAAGAFLTLPALGPDLPYSPLSTDKAFAKNGNGNGNGNGGGNSGGNGGGNSGGNGGGNSGGNGGGNSGSNSGGKGKSGNSNKGGNSASNASFNRGAGSSKHNSAKRQSRTTNDKRKGIGGFLTSVFGDKSARKTSAGKKSGSQRRTVSRTPAKAKANYRLPKSERATLTAVAIAPVASPALKTGNLNARLGRLNSLKRNYNAYLNSKDPHLASVAAYVQASLAYESSAADLVQSEAALAELKAAFDGIIANITPYDDFAYQGLTTETLQDRLADLQDTDTSAFTEDEMAAYDAEVAALGNALESSEFTSLSDADTALQDQKSELEALSASISDEALADALLEMANENRVREYGDDYVDEPMLEWAKEVLGVGDYQGTIDEIREATQDPDGAGDATTSPDETADASDTDVTNVALQ
ncbi:hypothetical protein FMN50_03080 [Rhodobacterales bacterium]|nr:hypothetical protein FMN50_03080 [Rhodobacterales bacterium]